MTDQNERIFFLRDKFRFPVACVATRKKMNDVLFTVATYNPIDQFSRAMARDVAMGRLNAGRTRTVALGPGVKRRIMESIATSTDTPQRTKQAARLWLELRDKKGEE